MSVALPPILYRVVHDEVPTARDFDSAMVLGRPLSRLYRQSPELWSGLSTYDLPGDAQNTSRNFPQHGLWIAELDVATMVATRMIALRQTGPGGHHYTVWGRNSIFLGTIGRVWRA